MICENAVFSVCFSVLEEKTGKSHPNRIHVFSPFRHALTMPAGKPSLEKSFFFVTKALRSPVGACTSLHISITAGRYPPVDIILKRCANVNLTSSYSLTIIRVLAYIR